MKRIYATLLTILLGLLSANQDSSAQNIQLHYDFGHVNKNLSSRPKLTTTVEHFRPDSWGNTFFFVDMNYQDNAVQLAYWEISRELKFWKAPLLLHLEYNGGLGKGFSIPNAYLAGVTYAYNRPDYSAGFTITPMYKHLDGQTRPHSAQLTATWYWHGWNKLISFQGFADLWGDRNFTGDKTTIFLSEPQLWLNLNRISGVSPDFNLSVGTEVEVSYGFVAERKLYALPTLALKWTF